MRDIKLRAWLKSEKQMWHNPYFPKGINADYLCVDGDWGHSRDNVILMQYTGLKDKNNKEIYEGDILAVKDYSTNVITDDGQGPQEQFNHITQVYYSKGQWLVNIKESGDIVYSGTINLHHLLFDLVGKDNIEVIGNKYENLELLST